MSAAIDGLIEISVYATVITAAILLFRLLFRRAVSPRLQYLLWLVLIARLLLPVTVESGFHVPQMLPQRPAVSAEAPVAEPDPAGGLIEVPGTSAAPPAAAAQSAAPRQTLAWRQIACMVWAAGALVSLGVTLGLRLRFLMKLRRSRRPDSPVALRMLAGCREALGVKGHVALVTTSLDLSPALTLLGGKSVLILPDRLTDKRALRYALLHELTHYRRGDQYMLLLMNLIRAVYWFHPVLYFAFSEMRADMETACDARVLQVIEPQEKRDYLLTLLRLFNRQTQPSPGFAQAQTKRLARKRMKGAFMKRKSNLPACMGALLLTLALLLGCFTTACQSKKGGGAATPGNAAMAVPGDNAVEVQDRSDKRYTFEVADRGTATDGSATEGPRGPVVTPIEAAKNALALMAAVFDAQLESGAVNVYYQSYDDIAMEHYTLYIGGTGYDAHFKGVCDASNGQVLSVQDLRSSGEDMPFPSEWSFEGYDDAEIRESSMTAASALIAETLANGRAVLDDSYVDGVQGTFKAVDPIVSDVYLHMDGGDCYALRVRYPSLYVESVSIYPLGWEYCQAMTWHPEYLAEEAPAAYVMPSGEPMPTPTLMPEENAVEISDEDYRHIALTVEAMTRDEFTAEDLGCSADEPFYNVCSAWLTYVLSDTLGLSVHRSHAMPLASLGESWLKPGMPIRFVMDEAGYLGFYLGGGRAVSLTNAEIHEVQIFDLAAMTAAERAASLHAALLYAGPAA